MTARIGAPKTGGRKRGSIDREQRKILTDEMAADLMTVYRRLGGVRWLLQFAKDNPAEFLRQGLSRLLPAPQRGDDPDVQVSTQVHVSTMSDHEAAVRVAYALSKATYESAIEAVPQDYPAPRWQPPPEPPVLIQPEPVDDPAKTLWIEELPLTEEQRRDNALVRQTHGVSLESYAGSSQEHGYGPASRPAPPRKPSAAELCRRLSRRGRDLL